MSLSCGDPVSANAALHSDAVPCYVITHIADCVPCAQVKKKMTCDEFLRNNRGINNGENLPPEFLQAIYASIVRNEIRTTSEAETGAFEVRCS